MSTLIGLDALFPPDAASVVRDANQVGAQVIGCYVFRQGGIGGWNPMLVQNIRAAGKTMLPIVVPGNNPPPASTVLNAVRAMGFAGGVVALDLEATSLPPVAWATSWITIVQAAGFKPIEYGSVLNLEPYGIGLSMDWVANWLRTGSLEPLPTLPSGEAGWQFANEVSINGHVYDASLFDSSIFEGDDMFEQADRDQLQAVFNYVKGEYEAALPDASTTRILDKLGTPTPTPDPVTVDASAVAAALAADDTFLQAVAKAVIAALGFQLSK